MLILLKYTGLWDYRKIRLFACQCLEDAAHLLFSDQSRNIFSLMKQFFYKNRKHNTLPLARHRFEGDLCRLGMVNTFLKYHNRSRHCAIVIPFLASMAEALDSIGTSEISKEKLSLLQKGIVIYEEGKGTPEHLLSLMEKSLDRHKGIEMVKSVIKTIHRCLKHEAEEKEVEQANKRVVISTRDK